MKFKGFVKMSEHHGLGAGFVKKQGIRGPSIDPTETVHLQKIEKDDK